LPKPSGTVEPPESAPAARLRELAAEIQGLEDSARKRLKAENPDLQPTQKDLIQVLTEDDRKQHEAATAELQELTKTYKPPDVPHGRTILERRSDIKTSHFMVRGDFRREGPEVVPAFLRVANPDGSAVNVAAPDSPTTRRRAQLAEWLTRPDNP